MSTNWKWTMHAKIWGDYVALFHLMEVYHVCGE